ncbi:MAG: hypoxanthine phosphoribosyltransferase [Chloroflexi bacterium]|nr:hypoxanthine phosphoribosyltransferase [Chloroflexota bacterium]
MFTREEVGRAVERLATDIRRDYRGKNPLLVGILKGSFVLLADLVRSLNIPLELDFAKLSSYGCATETSGKVRVLYRLTTPVKGRHVIVIEDIIDTGLTVSCFLEALRRRKPASLKLCALLEKPARRRTPITIDYLGFSVPDKFIVGYGLDCDEKYRYLPDVCYLEEVCGAP